MVPSISNNTIWRPYQDTSSVGRSSDSFAVVTLCSNGELSAGDRHRACDEPRTSPDSRGVQRSAAGTARPGYGYMGRNASDHITPINSETPIRWPDSISLIVSVPAGLSAIEIFPQLSGSTLYISALLYGAICLPFQCTAIRSRPGGGVYCRYREIMVSSDDTFGSYI